jgi:bifunctional DNase/RNase
VIEMNIESIRVSLVNSQRVILLKEKTGERYLPIWIGPSEADAIAVKLQGVEVRRPLTHDLLNSLIDSLGGKIESVVINELKNDTFYARINLIVDGRRREVDSRPSDALALAVRSATPILVEDSVLIQAGLFLDQESGKPILPEAEANGTTDERQKTNKQVSKEDLKRMSAYTDFINNLNLDDLDKRKS